MNERARIYIYPWEEKILEELKNKCLQVDFIRGHPEQGNLQARLENIKKGNPDPVYYSELKSNLVFKSVIGEIEKIRDNIDGVLIFGPYCDRELTSVNLPVIITTEVLWGDQVINFYKNSRVVTSTLCQHDISPNTSSFRLNELAQRINLIVALKRLKQSRLLNIIPDNIKLNVEDANASLIDKISSKNYEEVYFRNLKNTFGLTVVNVLIDEMNKETSRVDIKKAEKMADKWIKEAKEVRWEETSREKIIKAAQQYFAIVKLMKKYNCDAVTVSIGSALYQNKLEIRPPLAEMELAKNGIVTSCESLIDCLVTQMLGFYVTGRPSFIGDTLGIDPINDVAIYGHCYAPINPHGDDRIPYIIRSHAVTPTTVGIKVELPLNETVTVAKISIYDKKISIFTGKSADGKSLYKDFEDIACRTKAVVKVNNIETLMANYDRQTFGVHRVVFYGDYKKEFEDLSAMVGFEVVEGA